MDGAHTNQAQEISVQCEEVTTNKLMDCEGNNAECRRQTEPEPLPLGGWTDPVRHRSGAEKSCSIRLTIAFSMTGIIP